MLEIKEAQHHILKAITPIQKEQSVLLSEASNRVLANDVIATINVPPADNSAMDGYAINTVDLKNGTSELPVSQRIPAGIAPSALQPESAARIFTGGEMPAGADTVVMQENCEALEKVSEKTPEKIQDNQRVRILKVPSAGENIRPCGQDISIGQTILTKGQRLKPQHIGLLASIGENKVNAYSRVKVALLSTGDELVEPGTSLKAGQIYNSNLPMLAAYLTVMGYEVIQHKVVEDSYQGTCNALAASATDADIIISTGGVSVGEEDHVKAAVEALGELAVWRVNVKPGKPLAFGKVGTTPFLGLPGNPVSAFVTFVLFASPLLKKRQGEVFKSPASFFLPADFAIAKKRSRPEYIRVRLDNHRVQKFANQSSGVLTSICWAQALALIPSQIEIKEGDLVEVFPLDSFYI